MRMKRKRKESMKRNDKLAILKKNGFHVFLILLPINILVFYYIYKN